MLLFKVLFICFGEFHGAPIQHKAYSARDTFKGENHMEGNYDMKNDGMNESC